MAKHKNIIKDVDPLTTIHVIMSDVGSCDLKDKHIDVDNSLYLMK